ncbi:MAG: hypothetical protein K9G33_04765 [Sneathiella sp.]|nr:hypothetical protein [Sneathiella sp.]
MSDKKNDNDNGNDKVKIKDDADASASDKRQANAAPDNNDDEKKEDNGLEFVELESSDFFKKYAEALFDATIGIYDKNQKNFVKKNFDFYSPFYGAFQDSTEYKITSVKGDVIKTTLAKILADKKWRSSQTILDEKFSKNTIVEGLLAISLQSPSDIPKPGSFVSKEAILRTDSKLFPVCNPYFKLSTKRPYKDYLKQKTKCRIAICQTLSPDEFWRDYDRLSRLFDELLSHDFVKKLKIRSVMDLGSSDALLIYCCVPPEKAWKALQTGINKIIPRTMRRINTIPFSTQLDLGINANIPISYKNDGEIVLDGSFTQGLSILSKQAFNDLLENDKIEKTSRFNKQSTRKKTAAKI